MGMYDVMPTLANMFNFGYKYALGQLGINDPSEAAWGQGWRKIKDEWKKTEDNTIWKYNFSKALLLNLGALSSDIM